MEYELAQKLLELEPQQLEGLLTNLLENHPEAIELLKESLEDII